MHFGAFSGCKMHPVTTDLVCCIFFISQQQKNGRAINMACPLGPKSGRLARPANRLCRQCTYGSLVSTDEIAG